jgi:hypothetical protein
MPDPQLLLLAKDLRNRAEEILARAETFHAADAQHKLRKIAADYESLAGLLERRAGDDAG